MLFARSSRDMRRGSSPRPYDKLSTCNWLKTSRKQCSFFLREKLTGSVAEQSSLDGFSEPPGSWQPERFDPNSGVNNANGRPSLCTNSTPTMKRGGA